MTRIALLRSAFFVALVIAVLHILAVAFYLYSFYWWFDIPLHFLGGLSVGLTALYWRGRIAPFAAAAGAALAFGLMWELFEYAAGITLNGIGSYPLDTVKDLFLDAAGGLLAYLFHE